MQHTLAASAAALSRSFSAYAAGRLEEIGLRQGLLHLLLYVGKHPDCTQAELTAALGLDWGYCQRSTLRLVEDGFVLREKRGRAYRLTLSARGQQAFRLSHTVFAEWDAQTLAPLNQTERTQLLALLAKITPKGA